jgi:hypothetical protein
MNLVENLTDWDVNDLIKRFEKECVHDSRWQHLNFWNSLARQEMVQRGRESLKPIIAHLSKKAVSIDGNNFINWTRLLSLIAIAIKQKETAPEELENLKDWLDWAEKFA